MNSRLPAGLVSGNHYDSGSYTDLNRLGQFKVGGDSDANIKKVAQEFESVFVNEMMKSMRKANEVFGEDNFMNSNESKTYQDMYDQQLALTMSKSKNGIGLAEVMERQLTKLKGIQHRANPFGSAGTETNTAANAIQGGVKHDASVSDRDDSKLLNQRRLSLPSKLTDRLLAGIVPSASDASGDQPVAASDWLPASKGRVGSSGAVDTVADASSAGRSVAQPPLAPGKSAFKSAEDFITTMLPMAEKAAQKIGVDARYLVAQAALETGWGKSIIQQQDGSSSHNLFGIKAHGGWQGDSARVLTTEYKGDKPVKEAAAFRVYDSFEQSFNDYVNFLQGNDRYQDALASTAKPESFVRELQQAGYATDPQYARKISQIAKQMQTYQTVATAEARSTRS